MKKITKILCGIILGTAIALSCVACGTDSESVTDSEISSSDVTESTDVTETTFVSTSTETTALDTTTSTSTTDTSTETTTTKTTTQSAEIVLLSNDEQKATTQEVPIAFNTESETNNTDESNETEKVVTIETVTEAVAPREYVVYKPSTHYVHRNTCHWADSTCYEITDTNGIEARKCTECNPDIEIVTEYVPVTTSSPTTSSSMSYVKNFSRGTYYAYGGARYGGSGRNLIDCSYGDGTVKGSIASSYLYNNYGYNYNGKRTMVYLEISGYSSMNGYYYLDDSDAGNPNVIDFFYLYGGNCQFQNQGVVSVDCYIVNY